MISRMISQPWSRHFYVLVYPLHRRAWLFHWPLVLCLNFWEISVTPHWFQHQVIPEGRGRFGTLSCRLFIFVRSNTWGSEVIIYIKYAIFLRQVFSSYLVDSFDMHICIMRLFLLWLALTLGSIGGLSFPASGVFEPPGLQADGPDTASKDPRGAQFDNPSRRIGIGLRDMSQVAENSIAGNQEGSIISTNIRCRSPRGANRKRNPPDYCQNILPLRLQQQQENGRPSGTLNPDKPVEGNFILPAESNQEWAPPLEDFFGTDPCQVRPWQVCAPYIPGLSFNAWSFGRLAGFDLEGCDYCMYRRFRGYENKSNGGNLVNANRLLPCSGFY